MPKYKVTGNNSCGYSQVVEVIAQFDYKAVEQATSRGLIAVTKVERVGDTPDPHDEYYKRSEREFDEQPQGYQADIEDLIEDPDEWLPEHDEELPEEFHD